jgi:hypothetical protein
MCLYGRGCKCDTFSLIVINIHEAAINFESALRATCPATYLRDIGSLNSLSLGRVDGDSGDNVQHCNYTMTNENSITYARSSVARTENAEAFKDT